MKRLIIMIFALAVMTTGGAFADVADQVEKGMNKFFADNNLTYIEMNVEIVKKMDAPKGVFLIKMNLTDKRNGRQQEQYVFSDGKFIIPDILTVDSNTSVKDMVLFEMTEKTDLDLSKLSLMSGSKNAKHVIVEVSDFQCPYCKKAFAFLKNEIERRNLDVAVYIMHQPLEIHDKARLYAAIFEAGLLSGENFAADLFATDPKMDQMSDEEVINVFAGKVKDPAKFKSLVKSPSVVAKVNSNSELATSLGITGTPHVFFDGKGVGGFNQAMFKMALDNF